LSWRKLKTVVWWNDVNEECSRVNESSCAHIHIYMYLICKVRHVILAHSGVYLKTPNLSTRSHLLYRSSNIYVYTSAYTDYDLYTATSSRWLSRGVTPADRRTITRYNIILLYYYNVRALAPRESVGLIMFAFIPRGFIRFVYTPCTHLVYTFI